MKRISLVLSIAFLLLVGCSNDSLHSLHFKGESEHWKGEFSTKITDGTNEEGQFVFRFKEGKQMKKNLEINIDKGNGHIIQKESENDKTIITMPQSCSGCSVTKDSAVFNVTIKWDDQKESFKLK